MEEKLGLGTGRAPDFASPAQIAAHPRFREAVAILIEQLAQIWSHDRRLVRELFEYDRAVTFMLAVCIAMGEREDDSQSWLTLATLARGAALMGIGPERRVRRFVEEMRVDGHLTAVPAAGDRRRLRLHPTERMLEADREWVAAFHAPLAALEPRQTRYGAALARDPAYHRRYRTAALATLQVARDTIVEHPPVDSFLHQASGARVLTTLMEAAYRNAGGWSDPGFYTRAAERSATTRVHVRGMLRAAAEAGYVEIEAAGALRVRATPALVADFEGWAADSLSSTDLVSALVEAG